MEWISTSQFYTQFNTDIGTLLAWNFLLSTLTSSAIETCQFTLRSRVAICKQTALLHFTGLVMVFKRVSEANKVTIFIIKWQKKLFESYLYRMCSQMRLISPKLVHFSASYKMSVEFPICTRLVDRTRFAPALARFRVVQIKVQGVVWGHSGGWIFTLEYTE